MTKQKRSFLDKIMGGGAIKKENQVNSEPADIKGEDIEEVIALEENKLTEKSAEEGQAAGNNSSKKSEKKEDWFGGKESEGEEGQLAIDVYQSGGFIVVKSIVGGVRPENLDVSVTSDMVVIKGKRENPEDIKSDDYYYQECFWGNFSRSVILPCDIKADGVEATIKNGILTVRLPKIEKDSSLKIKVKEE